MSNREREREDTKEPFLANQIVKCSNQSKAGALFLLTDGSYFPSTGQFGATILLYQGNFEATGSYSIHWKLNDFEQSSWEEIKAYE